MNKDNVSGFWRSVPLSLLFTLLVQTGAIVWWASAQDQSVAFQEQRITKLEVDVVRVTEGEIKILERLARIEERGNAQLHLLDRIEKKIGEMRP